MGKRKYENADEPKSVQSEEATEEIESTEAETKRKKPIQNTPTDFDVKHFRKELALKHGQTIALNQFLQVCMDPDSQADFLSLYMSCGGNAHEILNQITSDNKKNVTLASPAFQIFQLIIMKVQSSMPHLITITEEACRYFLNTFMSTIEVMLSENSGPKHRRIALKLLTSIVTLNPELGIEILSHSCISVKHLEHIATKPNYKEKDNVRTLLVQFVTSFLVDGHLPLMKALLEKQCLTLVFPGLGQDEPGTVLMFLNILKKNVIENASITKSIKLKAFNHQTLQTMFRIFFWKGPPETEIPDKAELKAVIVSCINEIMTILFTSSKLGLYFIDKSLGTSDIHHNQNLFKALLTLKKPWENSSLLEFILNIVEKCPDLHRAIVTILDHSFTPEHSPQWENAVKFSVLLLQRLAPNKMVEKMKEMTPTQIANFIRFTCLPVPLLKHLKASLSIKDIPIANICTKTLTLMLTQLKQYVSIFQVKNEEVISALKNRLEVFTPKHLPTPDCAVAVINTIIEIGIEVNKKEEYKILLSDPVSAIINIIDLLQLYIHFFPATLEYLESSFDTNIILNYANETESNDKNLFKFKILSLWLNIDPTALDASNAFYEDFFKIMLEIYMCSDDVISLEAKHMLSKFLKNNIIFQANPYEVDELLFTLKKSRVNPVEIIFEMIEFVSENVSDLSVEVNEALAEISLVPEDKADFEKLFDCLMEGEVENTSADVQLKPTPFLIGSLKFVKQDKNSKKQLQSFITNLSLNFLYYYNTPELLAKITEPYKLPTKEYINEWRSGIARLPDKIAESNSNLKLIEALILDEDKSKFEEIFKFLALSEEESNAVVTLDGKYYVLKTDENICEQELMSFYEMFIFYMLQLAKQDQLSETKLAIISKLIELYVNMSRSTNMIDVLKKIFSSTLNQNTLTLFSPIENKKNASVNSLTKFIAKFYYLTLDLHANMHDCNFIKQFKSKLYKSVQKYLNKMAKKNSASTCSQLIDVIAKIGFEPEDASDLLQICLKLKAECLVTENNEPSIALAVLKHLLVNQSFAVKSADFVKIFDLYCNLIKRTENRINLSDLEAALVEYFRKNGECFSKITDENFAIVFKASATRLTTSKLAVFILEHNEKLLETVKKELSEPENLKIRELAIPFTNAAIKYNKFIKDNQKLLLEMHNEYKASLNKALEKPHKTGQIVIANFSLYNAFITELMDTNEVEKILSKIQKFDTAHLFHVKLLNTVAMKYICKNDNINLDKMSNYFLTIFNILNNTLKTEQTDIEFSKILDNFESAIDAITYKSINLAQSKTHENSIWQNFYKNVLKSSLKLSNRDESNNLGSKLLTILFKVIKILYTTGDKDISLLFEMVTSHSEFLNVMLSSHSMETKEKLIELVYTLIYLDESIMKIQQVPLYLSAYHATQSRSDKMLLNLIHHYEKSGLPVNDYKPYLWGETAANYYAVRKNRSSSLWNQPSPNQILNLFDKEYIENTVTHFSVQDRLSYDVEQIINVKQLIHDLTGDKISASQLKDKLTENAFNLELFCIKSKYEKHINDVKNIDFNTLSHRSSETMHNEIYDPAFVLPLMSSLLAPGSFVSCFKILRMGFIAIPIICLSSYCPKMRAAGYHVLHRFYQQLETETKHKNDRLLLTDFIETLRKSLTTAIVASEDAIRNPRLPSVSAMYLARTLLVITAPFDPLYKPLNNFLIAKEQIDFTLVPDFLNLFHDSDLESSERRLWVMKVIAESTKTMCDANVVFKTMAVKMVMDFYSSVLADRRNRAGVLRLIASLVSVPRASMILIEAYSLMSWLSMVINTLKHEDVSLVGIIIDILTNLNDSIRIHAFQNCVKTDGKSYFQFDVKYFKVNKDVENHLVVLASDLVKSISEISLNDGVAFLRLLNNVSKKALIHFPKNNIIQVVKYCKNVTGLKNDAEVVFDVIEKSLESSCGAKILDFKFFSVVSHGDDAETKSEMLKLLWSAVKICLN